MSISEEIIYEDGLVIEDGTPLRERLVFNQYSFLEVLKGLLIKYAHKTPQQADLLIRSDEYLAEPKPSYMKACLIAHESEYHWAMLIAHGALYWQNGVSEVLPKGYFARKDEYRKEHNLARLSFEFSHEEEPKKDGLKQTYNN